MNFNTYKTQIDDYLKATVEITDSVKNGLNKSMLYSLMAGGKRIRPMLVLAFNEMLGGDTEKVIPVACSVEMIHTYSLIHDDLPCMDNDDFRRGKPTNHVVFGDCTATLAGDALQPLAFSTIFSSSLTDDRKAACAAILAEASGCKGMCAGQYLDMISEGKVLSAEDLDEINNLKTGALLAASCMMGVASAGGSVQQLHAADEFGHKIGLAFQIRDDMLDVLSTNEELGKPVGSDAQQNKNTYMAVFGKERCEKEIHTLTQSAIGILRTNFENTGFLEDFALKLEARNS